MRGAEWASGSERSEHLGMEPQSATALAALASAFEYPKSGNSMPPQVTQQGSTT